MKKTWIILLSVCFGLLLVGGGLYVAGVALGADGYTAEVGGIAISATPGGFHFHLSTDGRTSAPAAPSAPDSPQAPQSAEDSAASESAVSADGLTRVEAELHLYDLEVTTGRELNVWAESEHRNSSISWTVSDGVLTIVEEWEEDWRDWRDWLNFDTDDLTVHLVLPQEGMEELVLSVSSDYSDLDIERCELGALEATFGSGEIQAEQSVFRDSVSVKNGAGDIELENCEIGTASLTLGVGDVEVSGSLSGELSAETGTGDIRIQLSGEPADYSYDLSSSLGEVQCNHWSGMGSYVQEGDGPLIRAQSGLGDVRATVGQ